jgi:hypothetical protein
MPAPIARMDAERGLSRELVAWESIPVTTRLSRVVAVEARCGRYVVVAGFELDGELDQLCDASVGFADHAEAILEAKRQADYSRHNAGEVSETLARCGVPS